MAEFTVKVTCDRLPDVVGTDHRDTCRWLSEYFRGVAGGTKVAEVQLSGYEKTEAPAPKAEPKAETVVEKVKKKVSRKKD